MKTKRHLSLGSLVILIIFLGISGVSWATTSKPITLEEALDLALQQNTSHALFLWEQDLLKQREVLEKHPLVTVKTDPVGIKNGQLEDPMGSLSLTMPLGENLDVSGRVTLGMHDKGFNVTPAGSLNLDYKFLSLPEKPGGGPTPDEKRQRQVNDLVLETLDLLMELRREIDLRSYEEDRLGYLETVLEAARLTPDYDDLELRKQIRDQDAILATLEDQNEVLQLQLATILGTSGIETFDPVLSLQELNIQVDEEKLREELFASNLALREARATLAFAQERLALERKTRGWDVNARGSISLNPSLESADTDALGWTIGLSATKTLYPRNIILEELELAVAQAEHALEIRETSLMGELRGAMQGVKSAQDRSQLKAEHLAEARNDLALRQRQYVAGLVTSLQVQDTALALQKADLDYMHETMSVARSILTLWNVCGRDIRSLVFQVIQ
ncbi:MAG TPA: TolC family protein [Limnochordia bacterium]|nr:TolC family protein [Limnochordia bacterium]